MYSGGKRRVTSISNAAACRERDREGEAVFQREMAGGTAKKGGVSENERHCC